MKKLLCLFVAFTSFAFGQVKYDFFTYFGKFPTIPKSASAAYSQAKCKGDSPSVGMGGVFMPQGENAPACNLDHIFGALNKELQKWTKELSSVSAGSASPGTGVEELMKKAQEHPDEEMSEADKQKIAAQMMAQAMKQSQPREIHETTEIMDAMRVYDEVTGRISQEKRSDEEFTKYKMDHQMRIQNRLQEINDQYSREVEAAGKIGNDKAQEAALKAAIRKKGKAEVALIEQEYPSLGKEWEQEVAQWKGRLASLADALKKANYGLDAKDPSMKQALGQAQSLIFGTFQTLLGNESSVWSQGANTYYAGKLAAETK